MKRLILLFSVAAMAMIGGASASAQKYGTGPDSTECKKYLSYYNEYYKQKNYKDALPNWRKAYKFCPPSASYNMLVHGTKLVRDLIIKNQNNADYKRELIDSLMFIYEQRLQERPKLASGILNNMGTDMRNFMKDEPFKIYEGLTDIIAKNGNKTSMGLFTDQVSVACDLYKEGILDPDKVINAYETAVKYMGEIVPKNETEQRLIEKTLGDIENLFISSHVADCDNLIALFTPRYEADPQNLDLAKNIVRMMGMTEGCMDNSLFLNAVTTMHKVEPSFTSAYNLYKLHSSRDEVAEAIAYMEEAISYPESDAAMDADYLYQLAVFCSKNGETVKSVDAANRAVELDPVNAGKSYMLLGILWGSAPVYPDGNEIEKRSKYWVAVDYMTKAKNADPTLAEDADNYIKQFKAFYPSTGDAFMYGHENGHRFDVKWNKFVVSTTVRTQN